MASAAAAGFVGAAVARGKRKMKSLFRRVRAELRRQMAPAAGSRRKAHLSFHYDPLSYALNFDNANSGFFC